jgi:pectin methylesterase-like acyl-CoA thioesterase
MSLRLFRLNRVVAPKRTKESTNYKTTSRLLLLVAICASFSASAFAGVVAVGTCTNHPHYGSIQEAVNSVPAGSTIEICPGTYAEQVLITSALTLEGVSSTGR